MKKTLLPALLLVSIISFPCHAKPSPVVVAPVVAELLPGELQLASNLVSAKEGNISAEVAGMVAKFLVEEGDQVTAGQIMVLLRDGPAKWRLAEASANLKSAEAELELQQLEQARLQKLLTTQAISQEMVDQAIAQTHQAQAMVAAARATVELFEDQLANHSIKAPFDGVVTEKLVEEGSWLSIGDAVVNLASVHNLRVEVAVPQKYFPMIGQNARLSLTSDISDQPEQLDITRIVPYADSSRNFQLRANLNNERGNWLPGMSVSVRLIWDGSDAFPWLIPADALIRKAEGEARVWRVNTTTDPATVSQILVRPGQQVGSKIAVASDELSVGDLLVIRGNEILQPGQTVEVSRQEP